MKSFYDEMEEILDTYSETENGAVAYKSSGKELVDFNFKISYFRENPDKVFENFIRLLNSDEDMETIVRYIFYTGDIREGLGERETFKKCLSIILPYISKEKAEKLLNLVPEYNRWDSVWKSVSSNGLLFPQALSIINNQIISDYRNIEENKPISLIGKWLPSENASSKQTIEMAKRIRKGLNLSSKAYRLLLSSLREYLNVVETKMSSNHWNEIDYEKVPSKANLNYKNAFLEHDKERREKYIESLKKGETKINSSVLFPHDIVHRYTNVCSVYDIHIDEYDEVYEQMWKALPKLNVQNTLVVRDGSGSMNIDTGNNTPLAVATSLAIYFSENNTGDWKDKFITFSSHPEIVDLSKCDSLMDKLNVCYKYDDYSNTDIYKTMKLILDTAIKNQIKVEDMPEMILIISDMQFDDHDFNMTGSLFDNIKRKFKSAGYNLPKICFWDVDGNRCGTIPLQENENGLILCSGFSVNIVKMFLSGKIDPYEVLIDTLYSERYNPIGEIFSK